ncbi:MAG: hypothetical protein ACE5IG_02785 [Dehalococcoidia bacterium]
MNDSHRSPLTAPPMEGLVSAWYQERVQELEARLAQKDVEIESLRLRLAQALDRDR